MLGACSLGLIGPGPLGEKVGVFGTAGDDVLAAPSKFKCAGGLTGLAGGRLSAELLGATSPSGMLDCPGVTGVPTEGMPVGAMPMLPLILP